MQPSVSHATSFFDERVLLRHLYDIYGQSYRDYRGKSLGHGRNYEDDAVDERGGNFAENFASVGGEARNRQLYNLDYEYECGRNGAYQRYELAELGELFLQGRARLVLVGEFARNLAELGIVADARDHRLARAARYKAARIEHVVPFGDGRVLRRAHEGRVLVNGHALAGEGALVRHELSALNQPAVGGQFCARFHAEDIAHDDFFLRYHLDVAVADDLNQRILAHTRKRFERLGAPVFHHHRYGDGDDYRDDYADALYPVEFAAHNHVYNLHGNGDGEGYEQDDEHRLADGFPNPSEDRLGLFARELVFAVHFAALFHFGGGKALVGVYALFGENVVRGLHVLLHYNLRFYIAPSRRKHTAALSARRV